MSRVAENSGPRVRAAARALGAFAALCAPGFGCDLARPDTPPPRGDEHLVERARRQLKLKVRARGADGRCKRKRKYYRDADKDGFGDSTRFVEACIPPEGYVANADDCYDKNAKARPDQKDYFHVHRGDGSFDYDCDKKESVRFPDRGYCRLKMAGNGCVHVSGWQGLRVPKCGNAAAWHWYACHEIHTPVLPEPTPTPTPAPTPAPGTGVPGTAGSPGGSPSGGGAPGGSATGGTASGGSASGGTAPGGTAPGGTAPGGTSPAGTPAGRTARPARPARTSADPGHLLEPVRPSAPPAARAAPRPAPGPAPAPTVPRVRRRTAAPAPPVEPSTRLVETRVRHRCAGRLTPWKKMQLCR